MDRTGALADLIRRARRRHISNLVLTQAVNAVSVGMAGLILLLLAGTQILDWPWMIALVIAASAVGFAKLARQLPSAYLVAQGVDRRLGFDDTLSTAWFYDRIGTTRVADQAMRAAQFETAQVLAAGVDVKRAVPFTMPKSLYAMAGLGLVATSLFALRYAVSHSLDLRPPLARMVFDVFNPPAKQAALENKKKEQKQRLPDPLKQMGLSLDQQQGEPGDVPSEGTPSSANETAKAEKRDQSGGTPKPAGISVDNKGHEQNQEGSENGQQGDENTASLGPPDQRNAQKASSGRQPSENQENNSLMDKFREAVANLLSRLKNGQQPGEGQQMASQQGGKQGQMQGGKSPQGKGNQKADGDQKGEAQGEEGEGAREPQSGAGKQGGSDADMQTAKEGKSGVGKEDGVKDTKEAEQLAAMGKISEILGKRAQNLTGEVMVEVASSKQQLKTAYSDRAGEHSDSGGEIHRDEIPLAYQRYVQQYFEEVRKPGTKSEPRKESRK